MHDVTPLDYIAQMWITEPEDDNDLLMLANVIDAFHSIGVLTKHQACILNVFVQHGFKYGVLEDFDKVVKVLEVTSHD